MQWQENIFENIASSEQTHTNSVRVLIERYGISDPTVDDTVGVFASPDMQKLYDNFVSEGKQSQTAAHKVDAAIEEMDIHDLSELLSKTSNDDIRKIYSNLQKGSRNHLRAFARQIYRGNETYDPRYIDKGECDKIVSSP